MSAGFTVTKIAFTADGGAKLDFLFTPDVKKNGVLMTHSLFLPAANEYDDGIDAVLSAANELLADALDDFPDLEAVDLMAAVAPIDEDDDE